MNIVCHGDCGVDNMGVGVVRVGGARALFVLLEPLLPKMSAHGPGSMSVVGPATFTSVASKQV